MERTFHRGEIYWCVDFPQSNKKRKDRPVVIVNPFKNSNSVLACKVTSTIPQKPYNTDMLITLSGQLSCVSVGNIHIVMKDMLCDRMGKLTEKELENFDRCWIYTGMVKEKRNEMNELIKVNYEDEKTTLSARDLHTRLEIATQFKDWFPRIAEYGFVDGADFNPLTFEQVQTEGGREVKWMIKDYEITLDMAKEICMLQKTAKGKEVRTQLIELEKRWNDPAQVMARALRIADKTIESLKGTVSTLQPKAEFYDAVVGSKTACDMAVVAKTLNFKGVGRNNLFDILRQQKVLDSDNRPYQSYVDRGWFRMVESKYTRPDGTTCVNFKTVVYQRGMDGIAKLLSGIGYQKSDL